METQAQNHTTQPVIFQPAQIINSAASNLQAHRALIEKRLAETKSVLDRIVEAQNALALAMVPSSTTTQPVKQSIKPVSSAAPYGVKKDGTPRGKPGRHVGYRAPVAATPPTAPSVIIPGIS